MSGHGGLAWLLPRRLLRLLRSSARIGRRCAASRPAKAGVVSLTASQLFAELAAAPVQHEALHAAVVRVGRTVDKTSRLGVAFRCTMRVSS